MQHELPHEQVIKEGRRDGEGERARKPTAFGIVPSLEPQWQVSGTQEGVQPSLAVDKCQMLGRERPILLWQGFLTTPCLLSPSSLLLPG